MSRSPTAGALLLAIAYIGFVSLGLPDGVIGVAWPSVRETFVRHQSNLGWIYIASGCGYFSSSFFTGRLLGAMTVGTLLAGSSALVATSAFGFSAAPIWMLFAGCAVLHGLGSGAIDAGLNNYVAHHFSARHMNWLHACYSLGATLGPLLMTTVLTWTGRWRLGYATIGVLMALLSALFIDTRHLWGSHAAEAPGRKESGTASMRATLRVPAVWLQVAIFFIYTGLEVAVGGWCFTVLSEARGLRPETAGLLTTCYWGSICVGRVGFGFVVDCIGVDRLLRMATALGVLGAVVFALSSQVAFTALGLGMIGCALAPIYPCLMTRTPERVGKPYAPHAIGFQVSAAMTGAALLPAFAGILGERLGLNTIPFFCIVLAGLLLGLHEGLLRK
jgi:fucose permease